MRISFMAGHRETVVDIARAAERLADRQREVSSGKRVHTPSDDPAAEQGAIRERAEVGTLDRYVKAADSVGARLAVVDSLFSDIVSKITTARSRASSATGSVSTPAQREALAGELEGLRTDFAVAMNTKFRGVHLFSGAESATPPYIQNAGGTVSAYQGSGAVVSVDIDRGRSVQVAWNGDDIMRGADASDLFAVMTTLIADVRGANAAGIATGMQALDRAFDRAVQAQARIGTDLSALEDTRSRLRGLRDTATARASRLTDANLAEAATGMAQADTAYRAALGAAASTTQLSLLDFLK